MQQKITLTPGENETLDLKLTSNSSSLVAYLITGVIVVVVVLAVSYYLKAAGSNDIKLTILDKSGALVRDLTPTREKGIWCQVAEGATS